MKITAVSGNTVTVDKLVMPDCSKNKFHTSTDLRRHATGMAEFVGSVTGVSGNQITLDYGQLTGRPKVGDVVFGYCTGGASSGAGTSAGGGITSALSTVGSTGIPTWVWIVGGVLLVGGIAYAVSKS